MHHKNFGRKPFLREISRRTEKFWTDGKISDGRTDGKISDGKFSDGRTEKCSDGKFSDGRKKFGRTEKFRTAVYPSNMSPIGAKLWQNTFQVICNALFFDADFFCESFFSKIFGVDFCFQECKVLEELWIFNPRWQMRRKNSLPELPLFLGRVPWRRGKRPKMCRHLWLGTKNDLTLWCDHNMIIWWYDIMIIK